MVEIGAVVGAQRDDIGRNELRNIGHSENLHPIDGEQAEQLFEQIKILREIELQYSLDFFSAARQLALAGEGYHPSAVV